VKNEESMESPWANAPDGSVLELRENNERGEVKSREGGRRAL
jgi:hypothetical protein